MQQGGLSRGLDEMSLRIAMTCKKTLQELLTNAYHAFLVCLIAVYPF